MSELQWAENPADRGPFWRRCVVHGLGLGLVAGALEMVFVLQGLRLSMTFGDLVLLGTTSVILGGVLGAVLGALIGALMSVRLRADTVGPGALCAGMVAGALMAWHVFPAAMDLLDQERTMAAVAFMLSPIGVIGVVALNSRYGLTKASRGVPSRFTWMQASLFLSIAVILGASVAGSTVNYGSNRALASDTSVLLLTVDTLRRDHVSAHVEGSVQTPALAALAAEGVVFDNAITPFPETAPAHGAMLTGHHPVRLGLLSNGHSLRRGVPTVTQALAEEGYATAAFVSSFALDSRTGLDQGFQAYDDDFFPGVRGLSEIRLARLGLRAVMRLGDPLRFRTMLERPGDETCARALRWVEGLEKQPFFLWVHLFEPHSPYEDHDNPGGLDHTAILSQEPGYSYTQEEIDELRRLYAAEVRYTDRIVGDFLERLRVAAGERPLAIVFASDHGEMLGEHDIMFNHHGIWDETVRVPMIIVPPEAGPHAGTRVGAQVRLMDLANTILSMVRMNLLEGTESADLTRFIDGSMDRDLASLVMGREGRALDRGTLYGYRAARQGAIRPGENLKYIWNPDAGTQELFDLSEDPQELTDIGPTQTSAVQALQERIENEVDGLDSTAGTLDAEARERLKALGYLE